MTAWPLVQLGEIATSIEYGVTAAASNEPVGPKFLRITDVQGGRVNWNSVPWCRCESRVAQAAALRTGDIVFARTGATTGKSYLIRECPTDAVFASYLIRVRVRTGVEPRFLSHFFKTPAYWRQIEISANGAAQPGVNASKLKLLRVPLPPLAEQRRIAEVLDRAEALRASRLAMIRRFDTFARAMFSDLFGKANRYFVTPRLVPVRQGERWELLTRVARLATGHTPDTKVPEYWGGDIPWISLSDIRRLDASVAEETTGSITALGERHSSAVKLPAGTVCFSRTASVGFVTMMGREMATSQDFVNWVCGPELNPIYLMWALIMSRDHLRALSTGSTHKTIYFPTVEQFRVLLPPLEVQRRFAAAFNSIQKALATNAESLSGIHTLFASLQQRAFRGEL